MDEQLDAALAQLVIRDRLRRRGLRFSRRSGGALVLQLEGPESTVRPWPEQYHSRYRGVLPVNSPGGVPAENAGEKELVAALLAVAQGCGYDGRPAYRLPLVFPRFAAAFAALYVWEPVPGHTEAEQVDELAHMVRQAIAKERRHVLTELRRRFQGLPRPENAPQQVNWLVSLGGWAVDALRFPHYRTVRWYRRKRFGALELRTSREVFRELHKRRGTPPADKRLLLVEALLADIDAHYGLFRRLNRARRPVILLPDVDTAPDRRAIRDTLLAAYDGRSRELRVYPVVVATSAPGAAPSPQVPNEPVPASGLRHAVPALFHARETAAEERRLGRDVPLPGRLLQVTAGPGRTAGHPGAPAAARRYGRLGPVTVAGLVLAVLAGLGRGGSLLLGPEGPESCGEGLQVHGKDCVGVSDGTGVFMPDAEGMAEVSARIEAENRRIAGAKHATVALLIPLESSNAAVRKQILSEVQGAHLAQVRANAADGAKPPVRLVLANPGRNYRLWRHTVDQLVASEPGLRVIAGFNLSLRATRDAMSHVTNRLGIPVVASVVTAGDFANPEGRSRAEDPYPGLVRAVPTSRDQARALLDFDPELAGAHTALVADTRPNDSYNASLWTTFTEARGGRRQGGGAGVQDMTFASPGREKAGVTPNEFEDFARNICQSNARVVYFAGRAFHLELFVKKLAGTYCTGKKSYTVITGSDATTLGQRLDRDERALLRGDAGVGKPSVSVRYTAPAHPDAWDVEARRWREKAARHGSKPRREDLPRYLAEPQDAMNSLRADIAAVGNIGPVQLDDGRTITTHDVVLTAAEALAKAAAISKTEVPPRERIKQDFAHLNLASRVQGAGGWICLTNAGNPYDKATFVVRLDPASTRLTFEGVGWPEGRVPPHNCAVPQTPGD
ncbi:hypothetical protein [Streptomyces sp. bgisy100]|uniref:hypothetical protein n=1 Tax=Streptomyces sp. bgisy100 TaxID=3413783 RepID=UPI003D7558C4